MLGSEIVSKARDAVNDTDSTNPFHSDAKCYSMLTDWLDALALDVGFPSKQQSISFAANDGGASGTKNLDNDWLAVEVVTFEKDDADYRLEPRTEKELAAENPNWRDNAAGLPKHYVIQDAVTAQAQAMGPLRTITTERPTSEARTMRLYGRGYPAVVSAGTNSPVFSKAFHLSGVFFLAWQMSIPRNKADADYFEKKWEAQRRKVKTLYSAVLDTTGQIWDRQQGEQGD